MNDANFCNNFTFQKISFMKYRFTDRFVYPGSPSHFIGILLKGTAHLNTLRDSIDLKAGDIFYIPYKTMYQSRWYGDDDGEIQFISLGFKVFPKNENTTYKLQILHPDDKSKAILEKITSNLMVDCLNIGLLFSFLGNIINSMKIDSPEKINPKIKTAVEYIKNNLNCNVSDIAYHCNTSESNIYSLFKRNFNKTPAQIKQNILISKAQELLLTTDKSVEEISSQLYFSSSSYFRKILKKHTGLTPRDIRKKANF